MADSTPFPVKSSESSGGRLSADGSGLDPTNPWIGLESYTESSRRLFFGRDKEAAELVRLIRRQTVTVLFGQSGLGKSSLLQAGSFPRLREADFLPLYLRLNHDSAAAPLVEQVKSALAAAFQEVGADAPAPGPDESLWEYFHRKDIDIWSNKNRLLTPVLAFDQFEEIFTLGRADDTRRARGATFLQELADLVENRPPAALRARLDAGEVPPTRFNFDKTSCHVVLILREDFLPDLEGLKGEMRSILTNRMRIRRLTGTQALEIVQKPAPHLLAEGVAERVVEFVAGARGGSADRLAELEVEPALLSVICRELNERRRKLGHETITADLVTGNRREILTDFYDRSVTDLPTAMREFVEDHLLTKSGFRDNFALETALETPGVTRELIDTLVSRRLLRIEEHLGVPRVELAHDVLAEVVRASRDARQQRIALKEARRHTLLLQGLAAGLVLLLAGASWIAWRAVQARRAEAAQASRTDFMVGAQRLSEGKVSEGLAYLVRAGRADPSNHAVGVRLMAELAFRNFALPKGDPVEHPAPLQAAVYWRDGRAFVTRANGVYYIRDTQGGNLLTTLDTGSKIVSANLCRDGKRVAICVPDGTVQIWDVDAGRMTLGPLRAERPIVRLRFSPDGRWLWGGAVSCPTIWIWDASTGEQAAVMSLNGQIDVADFSPDSRSILTWSHLGEWRVWKLPGGEPITGPMISEFAGVDNYTSAFHPDGKLVVIADSRNSMRFHDAMTGLGIGPKMNHELSIRRSGFAGDGKTFATVSTDQTAKLWEVATGKLLRTIMHDEPLTGVLLDADARRLVTWSQERKTWLWDAQSGKPLLEPIPCWISNVSPDMAECLAISGAVLHRWQTAPGAMAPLRFASAGGRTYLHHGRDMPTAWALYPDRIQQVDALSTQRLGPPRLFPTRVNSYTISPSGEYISFARGSTQELWDLRSPEVIRHTLGELNVERRWFGPDSRRLALREGRNTLHVWDTATGQRMCEPLRHGDVVNAVAYWPDGTKAVVGTGGAYVILWDLSNGRPIGEPMREAGDALISVDLSPDERWIAAGGFAQTAQVWDAKTRKPAGPLLRHRNRVLSVSFTRDSRRLLTRTQWQLQLWDFVHGTPVNRAMVQPYETKDPLVNAVISHDDSRIAAWTEKGEVRIWDSSSGSLVAGPISFGHPIWSLTFHESGRFLAASHLGGAYSVCPVPASIAQGNTPEWLLRLGEVLAGGEIDPSATFQPRKLEETELKRIRRDLDSAPSGAPFVDWGRWFLADRATRPIGPGLKFTASEAAELAKPDLDSALTWRNWRLRQQGKSAEVESSQRTMLARALKLEGEDSPRVATFRHSLAETLVEVGKFVEAETLERSALGTLNKQYAASEPPVVNARAVLGMSLAGQRRYAEAEPLLLDACTKIRESSQLGLQRRVLFMSSCRSLTGVLVAGGKPEMASEWQPFTEAETLARAMLARVMEQEGDTSWNASNWRLNLAEALRKVGRFGEAERYARECVQIRQTQTSANNVWLAFALVSLGATLAGC